MQTFFTLVCSLLVIADHLTFELTDEKVYFQLISCKDDDDFTKSRRDLNATATEEMSRNCRVH